MAKEKFLTLKEAKKFLGVSERSMYRYIHAGRLKAYKIGYWKIKKRDLQNFIRKSSFKPKKPKKRK